MSATIRQKNFVMERKLYEYDILSPAGEVVGSMQFRLQPAKRYDLPEGFESHIDYKIKEKYQGHGYGADALKAIVQKAAEFKVDKLIIIAYADNPASVKVIQKCGGQKTAETQNLQGKTVYKYSLQTPRP